MISVAEAEKIVLSNKLPLRKIKVPIEESIGHFLAESILADRDFPPFDRVAMDGIAIRSNDFKNGKRTFSVDGIQYAGQKPIEVTNTMECIEIMTGASMPAGFDTVIRYEDITINNKKAQLIPSLSIEKANLHYKGQDIKEGSLLTEAHQEITPSIVAVAATCGYAEIEVFAPPKTAVITTGDELVKIEEIPLPFQIRGSNSYGIATSLSKLRIEAKIFHLPDQKETLKSKLEAILHDHELVILSGGVSKGKADFVPETLEQLGVEKAFHRISQKPGKPMWFGFSASGVPVFGLPGNPVSSYLCLHRYVIPMILTSMKHAVPESKTVILEEDISIQSSLTFFQQVEIHQTDGQTFARPIKGNGSGDLFNLSRANGFVEIPEHSGLIKKGSVVKYIEA